MIFRRKTDCQKMGHWWKEWDHPFVCVGFNRNYEVLETWLVRDCLRCKTQDSTIIKSEIKGRIR